MKYNTAKFKWKCRNCGKTFYDGLESSPEVAEISLIEVTIFGKSRGRGFPVNKLRIHNCLKNKVGLADLIGYDLK